MRVFAVPISEFFEQQRSALLSRVEWRPSADSGEDEIRRRAQAARRQVKPPDAPALVPGSVFVVPGTNGAKIVCKLSGDASLAAYRGYSGSALPWPSTLDGDAITVTFSGRLERAEYDRVVRAVEQGIQGLTKDLRSGWQPAGWIEGHLLNIRDSARLARRQCEGERARLAGQGIPLG